MIFLSPASWIVRSGSGARGGRGSPPQRSSEAFDGEEESIGRRSPLRLFRRPEGRGSASCRRAEGAEREQLQHHLEDEDRRRRNRVAEDRVRAEPGTTSGMSKASRLPGSRHRGHRLARSTRDTAGQTSSRVILIARRRVLRIDRCSSPTRSRASRLRNYVDQFCRPRHLPPCANEKSGRHVLDVTATGDRGAVSARLALSLVGRQLAEVELARRRVHTVGELGAGDNDSGGVQCAHRSMS